MSSLTYELNVVWEPQQLKAGATATVTVTVNSASEAITSMYLSVPEGGIYEALTRRDDETFVLTRTVPWEAPAGTYSVRFSGRDVQGNRGPEVVSQVNVA